MSDIGHYSEAIRLRVPHGRAVELARGFCPSGRGAGSHGNLCPCDDCTTIAVRRLAEDRDAGRVQFNPMERALANHLASQEAPKA